METIKIKTFSEYIDAITGEYDPQKIYRGESKESNSLRPGVGRIGKDDTDEKRCEALLNEYKILTNFQDISAVYQECRDFTSVAVLAQHHGIPTRFLDWSKNPLVALYFAVRDAGSKTADENNGVVYIANVEHFTSQECINYEKYILYVDNNMTSKFRRKKKNFDSENIEYFLEYQKFILKNNGATIFQFPPICISQRMHAQGSMLTFHPDPFTVMEDEIVTKILIPAKHKEKIKDMLDTCGVHEFALFPGLDGLGKWLKDVYWPKFEEGK